MVSRQIPHDGRRAGLSFSNLNSFMLMLFINVSWSAHRERNLVACYFKNRIITLVLHVMLCSYHYALVFVQCPPPCQPLELWVEGGGLPNSESVSALVHILNPLCQCYIDLNSFFHLFKCTLSLFVQIMYRNNNLLSFYFPLCRWLQWLWRPQHTARRHLRDF